MTVPDRMSGNIWKVFVNTVYYGLEYIAGCQNCIVFSTEKRQIEQVQRNAACFVSNKPFNYQNPTSATSMIQQLN